MRAQRPDDPLAAADPLLSMGRRGALTKGDGMVKIFILWNLICVNEKRIFQVPHTRREPYESFLRTDHRTKGHIPGDCVIGTYLEEVDEFKCNCRLFGKSGVGPTL